jgi:DNA-binding CsgD family transcriptional regulator
LPGSNDAVSGLIADKASRVALRINVRKSPEKVLSALEPAIAHCADRGLYHRWSELLGLKAVAHKLDGDWQLAMNSLHEALLIAGPRQYLRTFLDESRELGSVLERMNAAEDRYPETLPLVRRLLRSINKTAQVVSQVTAESSAADVIRYGELTRREINILKRLESGMSNKEIAESIFISEGTLRWHLHNIYGKLGAKNRSGALVKARSMGLI